MRKPSGLGVWARTNVLDRDQLAELAETVEHFGYQTLWYPESLSYEALVVAGYLLSNTQDLIVASGIANIYARDAVTAAQGYDSLNRLYGGDLSSALASVIFLWLRGLGVTLTENR